MTQANEIPPQNFLIDETIYRQLFNRHNAVMLIIDHQAGFIVDANPAAANFYGYPLSLLRGMKVSRINAQPESEIHEKRQRAVAGLQNKFTFEHRLASNEVRTVEVHISTVEHKDKSLFFSIIHDITERKQSNEMIRNLAFSDHLTQLPNRHLFNDRFSQTASACKRSCQYSALMVLDLDKFKSLNDQYGHAIGDLLLIEVAERLKNSVREVDTIARFGGDEFVVMLSQLDKDKAISTSQAATVAEKIRQALSKPYLFSNKYIGQSEAPVNHQSSCSIGLVMFNNSEDNQSNIIKLADTAMYKAKSAGGNQVRFHDEK